MPAKFLDKFTTPKPINTLRPAFQFDTRNGKRVSIDEPPAKRQRLKQPPAQESISPYFGTPRRPAETKEVESLEVDHGSDVQEIHSNSTDAQNAASPSAVSPSGVEPYRESNPGFMSTGKLRRSRSYRVVDKASNPGSNTCSPSPCQNAQIVDRHARALGNDSPDILAMHDPPPAQIVSDVIGQSLTRKHHRLSETDRRNDLTQPAFKKKRSRASDPIESSSEDELQDGHAQEVAGKRRSNFNNTTHSRYQPKMRTKSRGDIPSTSFGNDDIIKLCLKRAAADGNSYDVDSIHSQIFFCYNKKTGSVYSLGDDVSTTKWLTFDLSNVRKVLHAATRSRHVIFEMSSARPFRYLMEFEDVEGTACLIQKIPREYTKEIESDRLQAMMDMAIGHAIAYKERRAKQTPSLTQKEPPASGTRGTEASRAALTHVTVDAAAGRRTAGRPKLKDGMTQPSTHLIRSDLVDEFDELPSVPSRARSQARATRSSQESVLRQHNAEKWSLKNQGWESRWGKSLVFPPTGKSRTTVDRDDIPRLDEGEFLNDNLISFYLRYLQADFEQRRPDLLHKVYFFSTFFFDKLKSTRGKINYEGVKTWTGKIDIFSYDYLIVPVNENTHWYLAIICNTPNTIQLPGSASSAEETETTQEAEQTGSPKVATLEKNVSSITLNDESPTSSPLKQTPTCSPLSSPYITNISQAGDPARKQPKAMNNRPGQWYQGQKLDPKQPKILTLDSLGLSHSPTCVALREYLAQEAKQKRSLDIKSPPTGMTAKHIPGQDNYWDCGVFVLGYVEAFLKDPDGVASQLLQKQSWVWEFDPLNLRSKIRELLFSLQREQQERFTKELQERKRRKEAGLASAEKSPRVGGPSRPEESQAVGKSPTPGTSKADQLGPTTSPHFTRQAQQIATPVKPAHHDPQQNAVTDDANLRPEVAEEPPRPTPTKSPTEESSQCVIESRESPHSMSKKSPRSKRERFVVELSKMPRGFHNGRILETVENDDSIELIQPLSDSSTLKSKSTVGGSSPELVQDTTRSGRKIRPALEQSVAAVSLNSPTNTREYQRRGAAQDSPRTRTTYGGIDRSKPQSIDLTG